MCKRAAVVCALAVLIGGGAVLAQEGEESTEVKPKNSLKKGAWAVQFGVLNPFNTSSSLTDWLGTTLSVKKHTSERGAYRLGLSILAGYIQSDEEKFIDDSIAPPRGAKMRDIDVEIIIQRVQHFGSDDKVFGFAGLGPLVGYAQQKDERTNPYYGSPETYRIDYEREYKLGLSAGLGAEWFLRHNISLTGEYAVSIAYSWRNSELIFRSESSPAIQEQITRTEGSSFHWSGNRVRLGASVYF
jgi:opacity protein-like surface antigen